ncbi:hypothetical protein EN805_30070 [bacterium M00.F.Ca.ET.162.01.1.1]|nr:hypothetical protein EN805_30070 [bacterium M00.F.Ca.ET.162.01.1.1]
MATTTSLATTTTQTAKVTTDTLGLKDTNQFLQSGSTDSSAGGRPSFSQLLGDAAGSVTTDLLNALNSVRGFGQNQDKPSGTNTDLTSDKGKAGGGYTNVDDTLKKAMKDILKPHD